MELIMTEPNPLAETPANVAQRENTVNGSRLREAIATRVVVADGAMATMLMSKGILPTRCFEELNVSLPALVRDVHREYMRAGVEILTANTFGANRARLSGFGFGHLVKRINQAGVRIARE